MRIKSVKATWLRVPIPPAQQHVSDLGRSTSFDTALELNIDQDFVDRHAMASE